MTESEWESGLYLTEMISRVRGVIGDRKTRLLIAACLRRLGDHFTHAGHAALRLIEGTTDGTLILSDLLEARVMLHASAVLALEVGVNSSDHRYSEDGVRRAIGEGLGADCSNCLGSALENLMNVEAAFAVSRGGYASHQQATRWAGERQAGLLREIVGNPFRPVTLDPRWLTSTVVDLSRAIYEERAFERTPILADALMDAGCDDEDVINHCHGDGPHVRGCWVVDLLLGKT